MNEVIQIFRKAILKGEMMHHYDSLERIVESLMDSTQYGGPEQTLTIVTYSYLEKVSYAYYYRVKKEKELIVDPLRRIVDKELKLLNEKTALVQDTWPDNYGWYLKSAVECDLHSHLPARSKHLRRILGSGFEVFKLDDGQLAIEERVKYDYDTLITDPYQDVELAAKESVESFLQHLDKLRETYIDKKIIHWKIGENHNVD